ncbi:uncharacterized protein PHACADRAFT_93145, partial [Phanerochaete carnosa HHB-10118-sp]
SRLESDFALAALISLAKIISRLVNVYASKPLPRTLRANRQHTVAVTLLTTLSRSTDVKPCYLNLLLVLSLVNLLASVARPPFVRIPLRQIIPDATRTVKSSPLPAGTSRELDLATCPPTLPATPVSKDLTKRKLPFLSPVPVLSPSAFSPASRAPVSTMDAAEKRIRALVKRELSDRGSDGLLTLKMFSHEAVANSCEPVDSDAEMWQALGERISDGTLKPRNEVMQEDELESTDNSQHDIPLVLGIEEDFRIKVVEWILDVMPLVNSTKKNASAHLHAQLTESPDTRWHAAHLFTRYFLEIGTSTPPSPLLGGSSEDAKGPRVLLGREAVTWDIGVACLALTVKFHRDFLHPLYPVVANDYLAVSPHTMEFDDLEAAHRDVLGALNFCIGSSTPGAYMEELLVALPSLRMFVDARGNWESAHAETWEVLFDTLVGMCISLHVNYLRYPICAITGCALVLGVVESIVFKRKTDAAIRAKFAPESALKRRRGLKCECDRLRAKAYKAVQNVEEDIREVFGVSEVTWTQCMRWLRSIER